MVKMVVMALAAALGVVTALPARAADVGSAKDVAAVRAAWEKDIGSDAQLIQVVAAGDYAIVETHDKGPNSPFVVLYKRAAPGGEDWQFQSIVTGPQSTCSFTGMLIPRNIAAQLVGGDPRLAATQKADPNAGCSGAM